MTIAIKIKSSMEKASLIRKMFEEGIKMKAEYGAENVFDFSLGNPNVSPPKKFYDVLEMVSKESKPSDHSYMPQAGNPAARESVAAFVCKQQGVDITANEIFMTSGAAGALNVVLKTILDPGDEVLSPAPCFVEYGFYADNYGGVFRTAPSKADFSLDMEAMDGAINEKTKALIINSPNNPTGQVYSREILKELADLLVKKEKKYKKTIYLIADEPYRAIIYDGVEVPAILDLYPESIVVTSYAKDLSLPGERIGYGAICPEMTHKTDLLNGMALAARIAGYVNAPAFIQRVIARLQGVTVDISEYKRKLDLLTKGLNDSGYDFFMPKGAFYLFPKSPIPDDVAFTEALKEEKIIVTPGSGFMGPGHFRIAYCVDDKTIVNSLPGFKRVMDRYR